jgi:hypothetical protein
MMKQAILKTFLILKTSLILSSCGVAQLKSCKPIPYKIKGEVCRYDRREKKEVCYKVKPTKSGFVAIKGKELLCVKDNLDRLFDSLQLMSQ